MEQGHRVERNFTGWSALTAHGLRGKPAGFCARLQWPAGFVCLSSISPHYLHNSTLIFLWGAALYISMVWGRTLPDSGVKDEHMTEA